MDDNSGLPEELIRKSSKRNHDMLSVLEGLLESYGEDLVRSKSPINGNKSAQSISVEVN